MHLPDGVLSMPVLAGTTLLAAGATAIGLRRMTEADVPRAGMLASAFFIASLIHVPAGVGSVHLLLNGLVGILLGWTAFPALGVALFLQAVFFGFGGFTALGANTFNMALPAVLCGAWARRRIGPETTRAGLLLRGAFAGGGTVLLTSALTAWTLIWSGAEFASTAAALVVGHLPVAVIEALATGPALLMASRIPGGMGLSTKPPLGGANHVEQPAS